MRVWRIIPGHEEVKRYLVRKFLREDFVSMGWNDTDDLSDVEEAEFEDLFRDAYTGERSDFLRSFRFEMEEGDIIFPVSEASIPAIGKIVSGYYYIEEEPYYHRRDVKWHKKFDRPIKLKELSDNLRSKLSQMPHVRETLLELDMDEWKSLVSVAWLIT